MICTLNSYEEFHEQIVSFGNCIYNDDYALLFHAGRDLSIESIRYDHYGSEYGSGFYCALNPNYSRLHNRGSVFNVYKLNLRKFWNEHRVTLIYKGLFYISHSDFIGRHMELDADIIFTIDGSRYTRENYGQVILKRPVMSIYLEDHFIASKRYLLTAYTLGVILAFSNFKCHNTRLTKNWMRLVLQVRLLRHRLKGQGLRDTQLIVEEWLSKYNRPAYEFDQMVTIISNMNLLQILKLYIAN